MVDTQVKRNQDFMDRRSDSALHRGATHWRQLSFAGIPWTQNIKKKCTCREVMHSANLKSMYSWDLLQSLESRLGTCRCSIYSQLISADLRWSQMISDVRSKNPHLFGFRFLLSFRTSPGHKTGTSHPWEDENAAVWKQPKYIKIIWLSGS